MHAFWFISCASKRIYLMRLLKIKSKIKAKNKFADALRERLNMEEADGVRREAHLG